MLGPEHPDTLTSVNDLALLLYNKGDYAGAEPLFRRALEASDCVLGLEHPDTLKSVNNLAGLLQNKGDYAGAERLYRRALEASERVLGPEHPHTLKSVNNLAFLLQGKGDYARRGAAVSACVGSQRACAGTGASRHAQKCEQSGLPARARGRPREGGATASRPLEGFDRVLGPEHPDTLTSVNNVAFVMQSKGDYAGAEPLHRRLEARERMLGPEHPLTLSSVNNLAFVLENKGDYAGAGVAVSACVGSP